MDMLTFSDYERQAAETDQYNLSLPKEVYCAMALAEEAGEVAGKVKKMYRDGGGVMTPEIAKAVCLELGDCLWYMARLANACDFNLSVVAQNNLDKLASRRKRGTLGGSGDSR